MPVNRKAICETKCTSKKNLLVNAKRVPESNLIVGTGSKEDKEYHCDIINDNL